MSKRKTGAVITAGQLWTFLEARFPKREYAFLSEVRNSTGFAARTRTADAIALSLWPSRGLLLHGIEIKQYGGDWRRERDTPEKAEEIARFCDFWWLALTDVNIAPIEEVPVTWGVLAPSEDGTQLVQVRAATKMEPQPWSRGFMAAVLRNASNSMVPAQAVDRKVEDARLAGIKEGEKRAADIQELERLRKLEQDVITFEKASGVFIGKVWGWQATDSKKLGEALKVIVDHGQSLKWQLEQLDRLATTTERMAVDVREHRKRIEAAAELVINVADDVEVSA